MTFAVVLGLSPTGLYVLRELGAAGIPLAGVEDGVQCGRWSRMLSIRPALTASFRQLEAQLLDLAARRGERGVLIPTSDSFISFLAKHGANLAQAFEFQDSYRPDAVSRVLDKGAFHDACLAADIAVPQSSHGRPEDLASIGKTLNYPLLLKPVLIHEVKDWMAGRKAFVCKDQEALETVASQIPPESGTNWLLQEIVPGPESNITLFSGYRDRAGALHQPFTCRKLRQYPAGFGSASLVQSETLPETLDAATRLLDAVGHHGIAGVEFKTDTRDEKLKIIEVNPRPSLWFSLSTSAGKFASLAAYRDLLGERLPPEHLQKDGIRWHYFAKDLVSAGFYAYQGSDFILPAPDTGRQKASGDIGAVFSLQDPFPAVREGLNYLLKAFRRVAR